MPGNTFGELFKITTFGESHGKAVGVIIDGCPANLDLSSEEIQKELDKRRPGQNLLVTQRQEEDRVEIFSGVFENKTLGTPITLIVFNKDAQSDKYKLIKDLYRPGHADYAYEAKYGIRDWRGGGRASGRETLARVAAGAIAKKILNNIGIQIIGYVIQIGKVKIKKIDESFVDSNLLRCPDKEKYDELVQEIKNAQQENDSVGGIIEVVAHNVPAGLGEPVFNKLSADLAQAIMSIPAVKGIEIGDGFSAATCRGSENNDQWIKKNDGKIGTKTNHAGGIIGGISTGEDIIIHLAIKPTPSIAKTQKTINRNGEETNIQIQGRHDPCICPRAVPVAEAMVALVLVNHYLLNKINHL
ncbi:MAG: chorismate synthase [Patescibacteria group bacterium]